MGHAVSYWCRAQYVQGAASWEGDSFHMAAQCGVAWLGAGRLSVAQWQQCTVHRLFYYYHYRFLCLCAVQVNAPHLNTHGRSFTLFLFLPSSGRKGAGEQLPAVCQLPHSVFLLGHLSLLSPLVYLLLSVSFTWIPLFIQADLLIFLPDFLFIRMDRSATWRRWSLKTNQLSWTALCFRSLSHRTISNRSMKRPKSAYSCLWSFPSRYWGGGSNLWGLGLVNVKLFLSVCRRLHPHDWRAETGRI